MDKVSEVLELEKTKWREAVLLKLRQQLAAEKRQKSGLILGKLSQLKSFRESRTIMFYVSMLEEVETIPLLKTVLKEGRNVTIPYIDRKSGNLISVVIQNPDQDLEPGTYGILEPKKNLVKPYPLQQIGFVIVPGIAFSRDGHRLGRGKGYYDRFLKLLPSETQKIGIAFDFQLFDSVPANEFDVKVDQVITN